MEKWMIGLFSILGIMSIILIIVCVRMHRMNRRIRQLVEDAIDGKFQEKTYDETVASSIEARLGSWISQSVLTEQALKQEKDIIQSTIADISHQTKTPIANLSLYTELLKEQPLEKEALEYVNMLEAQTRRLTFLIQALVKASRLETGIIALKPENVNLDLLFEDIRRQIAQTKEAEKRIVTMEHEEGMAVYDRKWTLEAVMNLVDNAIKYSEPGRRIQITGQAYEMFYRITVTDEGDGIPEEEQAKIFARFYRGTAATLKEGVGLGLYLTREIIQKEGGYIKLSSKAGEGSSFSIFLKR
ncbi:MAG: HAMP domain-containing histidine kinase [Lachnospiraceae bacterium]|nr:HAMP domain-containing histidine kinase [Lachnospiraceae bacterium]